MRNYILPTALALSCVSATALADVQVTDKTSVGGLAFFDVSHISLKNDDKNGNAVDTPPTGTGFDIKRFYLIVNHQFNEFWSANLTTDAQYSTAATTASAARANRIGAQILPAAPSPDRWQSTAPRRFPPGVRQAIWMLLLA